MHLPGEKQWFFRMPEPGAIITDMLPAATRNCRTLQCLVQSEKALLFAVRGPAWPAKAGAAKRAEADFQSSRNSARTTFEIEMPRSVSRTALPSSESRWSSVRLDRTRPYTSSIDTPNCS